VEHKDVEDIKLQKKKKMKTVLNLKNALLIMKMAKSTSITRKKQFWKKEWKKGPSRFSVQSKFRKVKFLNQLYRWETSIEKDGIKQINSHLLQNTYCKNLKKVEEDLLFMT